MTMIKSTNLNLFLKFLKIQNPRRSLNFFILQVTILYVRISKPERTVKVVISHPTVL